MAQQGQVFKLKTRGPGGKPTWAYRYRVDGRRSARPQVGGFASQGEATQALQAALERLHRRNGRLVQITLSELVAEYLAQHEVLRDELAQRDLHEPPVATMQPLERGLQRLRRLALTRKPSHLRPCRATPVDPIAVRPRWLATRASRLQLEHLTLLRHHRLLSLSIA